MANIEEIKKMAEENGYELSDEVLESVAGGYYSKEEWTAMTVEQRAKAEADSNAIKRADPTAYCKYWDKD